MVKEELIDWNEYPCGANGQIYSHLIKKYLKGATDEDGYTVISLKCIDGKKRTFRLHRVIYTYFYGTIPEGMQINHKNEIKTDNRLCNLELVTPKENCNWGTRNERQAAKMRGVPKPYMTERNKRLCSKPVVAINEEGNVILEFSSAAEAENKMDFCHVAISKCCKGKYYGKDNRFFKGYYWYYLEDYLKIKGVA